MKRFKFIYVAMFSLYIAPCYAQTSGYIFYDVTSGDMTSRKPLSYAVDQQSYTTGGVTFTYPANWFSAPPFVQVSIVQNSAHPTNETYVVEVSANSASATTVMAYQISSGVVTEAPGSSIIINLLAFNDPA